MAWADRKVAQGIPVRSARDNTHLIPEVRPLPGQRAALFKNAPGVFVLVAGRFAPLPMPSAFQPQVRLLNLSAADVGFLGQHQHKKRLAEPAFKSSTRNH